MELKYQPMITAH